MPPFLSPGSLTQLLGLQNTADEELEQLSTEELRYIHAIERQRLELTRSAGLAGGALGTLGVAKFLARK